MSSPSFIEFGRPRFPRSDSWSDALSQSGPLKCPFDSPASRGGWTPLSLRSSNRFLCLGRVLNRHRILRRCFYDSFWENVIFEHNQPRITVPLSWRRTQDLSRSCLNRSPALTLVTGSLLAVIVSLLSTMRHLQSFTSSLESLHQPWLELGSIIWKPADFEFQSYVGAWHKATNAFCGKNIYLSRDF